MSDSPPSNHSTTPDTLNDRDLLRRFVQDADGRAFEEIVRRHQGLVIGVCRRVLGNSSDIDDAFQATFLALARRPRQVRNAASISSWLYTVAWRTSWRLIRQRRKHSVEPLTEQIEHQEPGPLEEIASAQDCLVLDEELNALPAKYREVLVMTYFAGQGSQQIADELNVSKGTIDGRIRQARNLLRVRLARRGVAIGVLAVAAGLSTETAAAASPALLETTLQLGVQTLSGSVPGTTDLSHLEPFIRAETTMITSKLLLSAAVCVTAIAGLAGMNGLISGDENAGAGGSSVPQIQARVDSEGDAFGSPFGVESPFGNVDVSVATIQADEPTKEKPPATGNGRNGRKFEYYPADARPTERWLYEMLETPIPPLDFPGETPLSEVLEALRAHYSQTDGATDAGEFSLTLFPDMAELEVEGISSLEDVLVRDISFPAGMELRNALNLIFARTKSDAELTYEIRNEVMMITTKAWADSDAAMVTRIYEVGELLDLEYGEDFVYPNGGMGGGGGGFMSVPQVFSPQSSGPKGNGKKKAQAEGKATVEQPVTVAKRNLADLVMEMTSPPCQWFNIDGEGGAIRIVGRTLVVRQTPAGHREIVRLLNLLSESLPVPAAGP
ncbi:MAG: sigma-70 family RNA polymerase sigma factor [Planctomycetaceae bacterium]